MIARALIGRIQQLRDTLHGTPDVKLYYIAIEEQCENYGSLENHAVTILSLLLINNI